MKSQIKTIVVEPVIGLLGRQAGRIRVLLNRSRWPTTSELLIEVPLALALISALLLTSIATPGA